MALTRKKKKETKNLKRDETSKLMGSDDRLPTLFGSFRPDFFAFKVIIQSALLSNHTK